MTNTSIATDEMQEMFDALNGVFHRSDSIPASFLMDIFGLSREQASFTVREWRAV